MIIVSGWLEVEPEQRQAYLDACRPIIEAARSASGCVAFQLSADPFDGNRIVVFEQWESADHVEQFRRAGSGPDLPATVVAAHVQQHEIASTISLT